MTHDKCTGVPSGIFSLSNRIIARTTEALQPTFERKSITLPLAAGAGSPRAVFETFGCMKTFSYAWVLALLGIFAFGVTSVRLNQKEIWFSNLDQDSVLLINSLRVNDGRPPTYFDHPSQGVYVLYGRLLQIAGKLGLSPVGTFSEIERHEDPLVLMPRIVDVGRGISILVCMLCVAIAAAAIYVYTRSWEYAGLGSAFLFGSSGLLFQSLLVRSELTSVLFLCVVVLLLTLFARKPDHRRLLFFTGMAFGLAYATKIQVLPFAGIILLVVAWVLSPASTDSDGSVFGKMVRTLPALCGLSVLCALGFALISAFNLLLVPYALYSALEAMSLPLRTGIVLALAAAVGSCFYAYRRRRPVAPQLRDSLIGSGLVAGSLLLSVYPLLTSALERLRGRALLEAYHTAGWQVLLLALCVFAVGSVLLWQRRRGGTLSLNIRVAAVLLAGFVAGIVILLVACAAFGEPLALSATNSRLFTFASMTQFSASASTSAPAIPTLVEELGRYLDLYLRRNYLLPGYGVLFAVALTFAKVPSRYLLPSLMLAATGLVFMGISAFRHYIEQYWIYIDLFFIAAAALIVFGLIERRQRPGTRAAAVAIVAALYATQYPRVGESYPQYNSLFRDRIDLAAYAIHEVPEYANLMRERYGDDVAFMKRVLSDPRLNGADRGIDLISKPAIRGLIAANPHVQAAAEAAGTYRR